ncbi:hypothetical protein H4Q26_016901 [Puccinia striiformis f. sp. tritici PST-130]|nr:hypothetical protein Pst134EB_006124 [Puccinia striiformis f. sp. tritici]KAI9624331.1 hypothetical protein H4Q26_016901 [Puccinia striiformis f. sp. tritici PST-130]
MKTAVELYDRLDQILSTLSITEIEIFNTPIPSSKNEFIINGDHHQLGIPQKILAQIYAHASQRFHTTNKTDDEEAENLFKLTRILLIQNPDHLTALSTRRKLLKTGEQLREELELNTVLLSVVSHSKSTGLWFHRRWIFAQLHRCPPPTSSSNPIYKPFVQFTPDRIEEEFVFNLQTCDRYPRNYYAWFHRKWVLSQLPSLHPQDTIDGILDTEKERILRFMGTHPKDNSATNYIQFIVTLFPEDDLKFIDSCLAVLVNDYHAFESGYNFAKFVIVHQFISDGKGIMNPTIISKLLVTIDSYIEPESPSSCLNDQSEDDENSSVLTLAQQAKITAQKSESLMIRAIFYIGYQLKWIEWSDELVGFILGLTRHEIFSFDDHQKEMLKSLKTLVLRF